MKLLSKKMGEIPLSSLSIPLFEKMMVPFSTRQIGAGVAGDYLFQEFPFCGGFVRLTHLLEQGENKIIIIEDKPGIIFQLGLQNSLTYKLDDIGEMLFNEWAYNFYYTLSDVKEIHFRQKNNYVVLEVQMSVDYLQNIGLPYAFVSKFLDRVQEGKSARMARANQVANPSMMDKVRIIFDGDPAKMDDRAMDLLLLALENQLANPVKKIGKMSPLEVEKIYAAKEFLLNNLHTKYTQEELAVEMKISVYQIKKGFQEIYGMTFIEFSHIERMNRADKFVAQDEKKMWEIATILGYKSESSFLRAFKQHYGETPSNRQRRS